MFLLPYVVLDPVSVLWVASLILLIAIHLAGQEVIAYIAVLIVDSLLFGKFLLDYRAHVTVVQIMFPCNFHTITSLQKIFFVLYYVTYHYITRSRLNYFN